MLKTQEEIIKIVRDGQANGQSFVVTNGCFDILHVGHVRYLQKTKQYADNLIVMLNSDVSVKSIKGPDRPINCEADRAEILSSLSCVDYVVLFDEKSPAALLESIKPDVYTKGADYTIETLPEAPELLPLGVDIQFISFVEGKSTTNVINKMRESSAGKNLYRHLAIRPPPTDMVPSSTSGSSNH